MVDATSNQLYVYHFDGTGHTVALTNASQQTVNTYAYDPFGRLMAQHETIAQPFKYAGQVGIQAEGNNLYYMRARYYDANLGRFISEDPAGIAGGLNLFAYVGGNPMILVDPTGRTQADVNRAISILSAYHPEYYNLTASVNFGVTPPSQSGETNFFTGNITLSNEYSGSLSFDQNVDLLQTLAHEFQHSNQSVLERAVTNIEDILDISDIHDQIYRNSDNLSSQAYKLMNQSKGGN
jgi:RHS repeat-associated protein